VISKYSPQLKIQEIKTAPNSKKRRLFPEEFKASALQCPAFQRDPNQAKKDRAKHIPKRKTASQAICRTWKSGPFK